ncbi:MAG: DUF3280 domain-containing protein [Gammaproteobacteria bacterium]|nr:DUF3280 domain-containing protein [Gammaproteobacteria bacterium]
MEKIANRLKLATRFLLSRLLAGVGCLVLSFACLLTVALPALAQTSSVIVLEFELNDLTLNPDTVAETERTATLRPLLVAELQETHGIEVRDNPESAALQADKGAGYLFDRPAIAAEIAREAGASWVVTGRLHKASFLFVYLKAQLVNAETGAVAADFVVEIKGPQKKLTKKGVITLAVQVQEAIAVLERAG